MEIFFARDVKSTVFFLIVKVFTSDPAKSNYTFKGTVSPD
jgi:hypothetical protein